MEDKKIFTSYSIRWNQSYSQQEKTENLREQILEHQLNSSELSEAKSVIERIKGMK
jgi:hypothetical protein